MEKFFRKKFNLLLAIRSAVFRYDVRPRRGEYRRNGLWTCTLFEGKASKCADVENRSLHLFNVVCCQHDLRHSCTCNLNNYYYCYTLINKCTTCTLQGGQFLLSLVDYYGTSFVVFFLASFEITAIMWVYGLYSCLFYYIYIFRINCYFYSLNQ